jgi:adenylate cyclase
MTLDVADWLLEPSTIGCSPQDLLAGIADHLNARGLPIVRLSVWLATAHPEILGTQIVWTRAGIQAIARDKRVDRTPSYVNTPAQAIHEGSGPIHCRLDVPRAELRFPMLAEIADLGGTDYYILPVGMGHDKPPAWIAFSTDRPSGFTEADIQTLGALEPLLMLHFQLAASRHATRSLLNVYLGNNAAERVLSGSFRRGRGTLIDAAIFFCDMRGFTALGDRMPPEDLVRVLNAYFQCVAGPIEDQGGEILKLIGDAVLAIFPIGEGGPAEPCRRALAAAEAALDAVETWCREEPTRPSLAMGVGLHLGPVVYGNIGARTRLDFTVIGAAVNEVSRVESLCKTLGPLLMTSAFARALGREDLVELGRHTLRGVSEDQTILSTRARAVAKGA